MATETSRRAAGLERPVTPLSLQDAEHPVAVRFRDVLAAQPDAVAVADPTRALTYAQLAAEAAGTLAALRAAAPGAGEPVCLLHSHSAGAVAALLAVLASGHPVAVLDPRTPSPRLRQLATTVGAPLCIADPAHLATAEQLAGSVLVTDPGGRSPGLAPDLLWQDPPDPRAPAALAFTSGSTGRPKVVVNDHRMLVRDAWTNSAGTGCYSPHDVVAHTLPLAFHAGLMISVAGLLVGARMELYDVRGAGIAGLPSWLHQVAATVAHTSPAILRALIATGPDPAQLAGLRSLTIAGEAAHGRDVEAARALLPPSCVIRNRYGSSETGLIAEYAVDATHSPLSGPLPVGRPVGDTELVLVDGDGRPVAPGEAGTVTVTTSFLATGYWRDPQATAAAFTVGADGRRTFRSSDVGRVDGGELRLLGRRDHSVKIRGYLVEPGEVDAALFALPGITEAVTVGADRPGVGEHGKRLVAYVVSTAAQPSAAAIRAALRAQLPAHMVPEAVVFLPALPRTERGKLDRAALPEPPAIGGPQTYPPMTEWQKVVADVWARALELESVGPDDDFFALGGDSLAAEALLSMVIADLGVPADGVTSSLLVQAPTVREFAHRLRRRPDALGQVLVPLRPQGQRPPLFVVAGGGGLGVAFVPLARRLPADRPAWALQSHAMERRGLPDWTVRRAARRHVRALRTVQPHGPYHLAGHSFGGLLALEMAHQLRAAGEQVALLALLDSFPPDPALQPPPDPKPTLRRWRDGASLALTGVVAPTGTGNYWRYYDISSIAARRYRCAPYPGRALVVVADSPEREARSAWAPHLSGRWDLVEVPGDHLSMIREPHVQAVADVLAAALAAPTDGTRPTGPIQRTGVPVDQGATIQR